MLSTREWLVVIGVAVAGAAATMVLRAVLFAFRLAYGIVIQSVSALVFWAFVGVIGVFLMRWRMSRRSEQSRASRDA